jgi:hypothetical protein
VGLYLPTFLSERKEIMSKYQDIKDKLSKLIDNKITIYIMNDFGFPCIIHTVLNKVEMGSYAQYREALTIIHKPKGKRNLRGFRMYGSHKVFLIWEGWKDIDPQAFVKGESKNPEVTITKSKYTCFNSGYTTDILNSTEKPYLAINTPEEVERLYDLSPEQKKEVEELIKTHGNIIPELYTNRLGLTPRHVTQNFEGVKVLLGGCV